MGVRKYTEARREANKRSDAKTRMHLSLSVPAETGQQIRHAAEQDGQSVNAWILDAIREKL